jgi:hypothetical protein
MIYFYEYVNTNRRHGGPPLFDWCGLADTVEDAIAKAEASLPAVRERFGPKAGYRVLDLDWTYEFIGPSVKKAAG